MQWSHVILLKPWLSIKELNFLYHYLGACFNAYKLFFNLHTSSSLPLTLNPLGCSINISSFKSPCKKVVFMSSYSISKFKLAANPRTTQIEDIFTTGENISSKSIPFFWPKPFTTNLALYRYCELFSVFNMKTHLFFIAFFPLGSFTKS